MDCHTPPPPPTHPKRKASPTPQPPPTSSTSTWNAFISPASTTSIPPSRSSRASRNSAARARKKELALCSNFEAQHDNILATVINAGTGSTTRNWKPYTSPAVLSSNASQAAYKGWQNRRSGTPASSPARSSPEGFATPVSTRPVPSPIRLPPFSSLAPRNAQAAGPRYVSMPTGFGGLELARGPARPINGVAQVQKEKDSTRKALKRHYEAYVPGEDMKERARRVVKAELETIEGGEGDGGRAQGTEPEQNGGARE